MEVEDRGYTERESIGITGATLEEDSYKGQGLYWEGSMDRTGATLDRDSMDRTGLCVKRRGYIRRDPIDSTGATREKNTWMELWIYQEGFHGQHMGSDWKRIQGQYRGYA